MQPVLLYITAKDKVEAEMIARRLLEARLIACANILPGTHSLYWWEGTITEAQECVLVAKSVATQVPAIVDLVKSVHSYDCPGISALPITAGNPEFLKWIAGKVQA